MRSYNLHRDCDLGRRRAKLGELNIVLGRDAGEHVPEPRNVIVDNRGFGGENSFVRFDRAIDENECE